MATSPSGNWVAAALEPEGDEGAIILLYDTITHQQKFRLEGHHSGVRGLWASPDGCLLVSAGLSLDMPLVLWDAATGELVAVGQQADCPTALPQAVAWLPSAKQPSFFTVTMAGSLYLWLLGPAALDCEQIFLPEAMRSAQLQALACVGAQCPDGSSSLVMGDSAGRAWIIEVGEFCVGGCILGM